MIQSATYTDGNNVLKVSVEKIEVLLNWTLDNKDRTRCRPSIFKHLEK